MLRSPTGHDFWWGLPQSPTRPAANNPIFFLAELQFLWGFFIQAILGKLDLSFQWTVYVEWFFPRSNTPKTSGPRISIWYVQFPQLKVDWSGSRSLDTSVRGLTLSLRLLKVCSRHLRCQGQFSSQRHPNSLGARTCLPLWKREEEEECMLVAEEEGKEKGREPSTTSKHPFYLERRPTVLYFHHILPTEHACAWLLTTSAKNFH